MLSFENDYSEGAHPKILEKLAETNFDQLPGYGLDPICDSAKARIRKACGCENADVFFLSGGTQANRTVIASMLKNYEGVVAAETGHVGVHEAGAIENSGHKVICLPQEEGKLVPERLEAYLKAFFADANNEHMVFPGMVYISFPTELGTLYSKAELERISSICREYGLPLFIDGARLGYGLMSVAADITLPEFAALADVFYIGGTKVGALIGEAVVFPLGNAPKHFMTTVKQNGALLAKGRLLGVQFDALFENDLYFKIAAHAIEMAAKLKEMLIRKGCEFYMESPTNQQFIIMDDEKLAELSKKVAFSFWEKYDEKRSVIRFATSWATTPWSTI